MSRKFQLSLSTVMLLLLMGNIIATLLFLNLRESRTRDGYPLHYDYPVTKWRDGTLVTSNGGGEIFIGSEVTAEGWPFCYRRITKVVNFVNWEDFQNGLVLPQTNQQSTVWWSRSVLVANIAIALAILAACALAACVVISRRLRKWKSSVTPHVAVETVDIELQTSRMIKS